MRTSDVYFLSGDESNPAKTKWEFKGPTGNGRQTIAHQFQEAAGQARNVVIDATDIGSYWTEKRIRAEVKQKLGREHTVARGAHKGEQWWFDEALIIFSDGSVTKLKRG